MLVWQSSKILLLLYGLSYIKLTLWAFPAWHLCVQMTLFNLQNVLCVWWSMFHFPIWQVTTFQNIEGMLEKVHYVAEGTLIYLRETSEVFIRVRKGWRKLQVLLHHTLIFSNSLPHNEGEGDIFTEGEKYGCKDSFFFKFRNSWWYVFVLLSFLFLSAWWANSHPCWQPSSSSHIKPCKYKILKN